MLATVFAASLVGFAAIAAAAVGASAVLTALAAFAVASGGSFVIGAVASHFCYWWSCDG